MASLETIISRIDEIDAKLAAGVKSAASGDERVDYDMAALKEERNRLERIVSSTNASKYRRVVFKSG